MTILEYMAIFNGAGLLWFYYEARQANNERRDYFQKWRKADAALEQATKDYAAHRRAWDEISKLTDEVIVEQDQIATQLSIFNPNRQSKRALWTSMRQQLNDLTEHPLKGGLIRGAYARTKKEPLI